MPNEERREKVLRFERYNSEDRGNARIAPKFHDNDVRSLRVIPGQKTGEPGIVQICFYDREEKVERTLSLKECVNLRFAIDFDILSDNTSSATSSAGQTSNVEIKECNDCIERLIKQNIADWNVEYPPRKDTPASYKLYRLNEFILVKILLHGGTLEVVARDFQIENRAS